MEVKVVNECERLKLLRKELRVKQGDFAKRISTTQGHISDIENGRKGLSDRTIKLISYEFGVSEEWLRNGTGEMFEELDRDEEIAAWSSKITRSDYDKQFVPEFVHMLSKLDERDWETLEKIAKMLAKKKD